MTDTATVDTGAGAQAQGAQNGAATDAPKPLVTQKETTFWFRKDKVTDVKRPDVKINVPFLTEDGLVEALMDEKQRALVLEAVNDIIKKAASEQVNDDTKPVNTQEELDLSKLTLEFIANLPPAARKGGGISKEIWEEFAKDYIAIMPSVTGRELEKVQLAATIMTKRLQPVKYQKKLLTFVAEQLDLWFTNTKNKEEFMEVYEFLSEKAKEFLEADESKLLDNLA